MPFPNEHAARLRSPNDFDPKSFRTTAGGKIYGSIEVPKTINIIWGKLTGKAKPSDPPLPQSLRFDKKAWTVVSAKKWLKDNKVKYTTFEKATEKEETTEETILKEKQKKRNDVIRKAIAMSNLFGKGSRQVVKIFNKTVFTKSEDSGLYHATDYVFDSDGKVSFGKDIEVDKEYSGDLEDSNDDEIITDDIKNLPELTDTFFSPCLVEAKDDGIYLKGLFAVADKKNDNGRIYPRKVLVQAIKKFRRRSLIGMDGHKFDGSYRDVALKYEELSMENDKAYCRAKIIDTSAGDDLKVVAQEGIPIGLSMRGRGDESYDEKKKATIVQDNYRLVGIDAVLEPAFNKAKAILEQREKKEQIMDDKLKEQIEALTLSITELKGQVTKLQEDKEGNAELLKTVQAQLDKEKAIVEAKTHVAELLESDDYKEHEFKDVLRSHLEKCESKDEVDKALPVILETLKTFKGRPTEPEPTQVVITEHGFFGANKVPSTIPEAYKWLLDNFEDKGIYAGDTAMDNPRYIAKILLDNYLKMYIGGFASNTILGVGEKDIMQESKRNPLRYLTKKHIKETLGDTEAYTSDLSATAAYMLPLYTIVMKDLMDVMGKIVAIQPLDRPTGKVFFAKELYGDGSGTWIPVPANFSKTKAQKSEGAAPQYMKVQITSNDVALKTALKLIAPFTIELEQDLKAYHGLNIDSVHVAAMRREIFREISHQVLNDMLTGTSFANSDNKILAGVAEDYSLSPDSGFTGGEWLKMGLTKAFKIAGAQMDKDPWNIRPDYALYDSDYSYLFTEPHFVSDQGKVPTGFGFRKEGTYQNEYGIFSTSMAAFNDIILLGYRGVNFTDAGEIFMPYVLFYVGPRIDATAMKASRSVMSRFSFAKAVGAKFARINIVP